MEGIFLRDPNGKSRVCLIQLKSRLLLTLEKKKKENYTYMLNFLYIFLVVV